MRRQHSHRGPGSVGRSRGSDEPRTLAAARSEYIVVLGHRILQMRTRGLDSFAPRHRRRQGRGFQQLGSPHPFF